VTFERNLARVSYENFRNFSSLENNKLSRLEHVLFLQVSRRLRIQMLDASIGDGAYWAERAVVRPLFVPNT